MFPNLYFETQMLFVALRSICFQLVTRDDTVVLTSLLINNLNHRCKLNNKVIFMMNQRAVYVYLCYYFEHRLS